MRLARTFVLVVFAASAWGQYALGPASTPYSSLSGSAGVTPILLGDESVSSVTLPFEFPWPGGNTNIVVVHSNGTLHLDGSLATYFFVRDNTNPTPARISFAQEDLNPILGGIILQRVGPESVVFSFEQIPFFGAVGSIEAQVELFRTGDIEVRYGTNLSGGPTRNIHCGPVGPGLLGVTAQPIIPEFGPLGTTSQGVLPQNTGVRFLRQATAPLIQSNSAASSLTVDGRAFGALCRGDFATILATSDVIGAPFEILTNLGPRLPLNAGGQATSGGQTINLDISSSALNFVNEALGLGIFPPHPGLVRFDFYGGATFLGSGQQCVIDPSASDGFRLSAAIEIESRVATPISGNLTGDDSTIQLAVGGRRFPSCLDEPIRFYGTRFNEVNIDTNGRVFFEGSGSRFSPTVAEALTQAQVAYWADFDQTAGGTISYRSDVRLGFVVTWSGVPYFGDQPTGQSFEISFDSSGVLQFDVMGLLPRRTASFSNDAFLGISSGTLLGGATDPGPAAFGLGSGQSLQASDLLYAFGSLDPAQGSGLLPEIAALQAGLGLLRFVPNPVSGGYTWSGF